LLAIKGGRWHILAGWIFTLGMVVGTAAGLLLAAIRPEPEVTLFLLGLLALFFRAGLAGRLSLGPGADGGRGGA
jgi:hypothetical protein